MEGQPAPAARYLIDAQDEAVDVRVRPRDLGTLFAEAPLIQGENEADYDTLLERVTMDVAPMDVIEAMWIKDIVDLIWDTYRLRRLKAGLLMSARRKAVHRIIELAEIEGDDQEIDRLWNAADDWLRREPSAEQELDRAFAPYGFNVNSIMAQALSHCLGDLERIERLIASQDARRIKLLTEIERRREALARRLRKTADDITDGA
jgi:hypothetical protein